MNPSEAAHCSVLMPEPANALQPISSVDSPSGEVLRISTRRKAIDIVLSENGKISTLSGDHVGLWERRGYSLDVAWDGGQKESFALFSRGYKGIRCAAKREIFTQYKSKIPKVIHAIWLGSDISKEAVNCVRTWIAYHPEWQLQIWDESRLDEAMDTLRPAERLVYDDLTVPVLRSVLLRLTILRKFGGAYVDVDFKCLRYFLDLCCNDTEFFFGEKPGGGAECAMIGSVPDHQYLDIQISKSVAFWSGLTRSQKEEASRTEVIWPFDNFDRNVADYLKGRKNNQIIEDEFGNPLADFFEGGISSVRFERLHGARDAVANHQYDHSWW